MLDINAMVAQQAQTLCSLVEPVQELIDTSLTKQTLPAVVLRGVFNPAEDEQIALWLARYLSVRAELWSIIERVDALAGVSVAGIRSQLHWRCFVIGFCAACLLVRVDRFFLFELATDKLIQKKLNQTFKEYRIPAKSYTRIFDRFTNPNLAFKLYEAMWLVRLRRRKLSALKKDEVVGSLADGISVFQTYLDPSKRNYLRRTVFYTVHAVRRKFASARQKSMFAVLEKLGRATSELSLDVNKQVTHGIRQQALGILKPGDVLVTRHKYALTNFFLPGKWPHAALYIGTPEQRDVLGVGISADVKSRWHADISTFEALKDGVKLRSLEETLSVDCFVLLRPNLSNEAIKSGIERVLKHEGKRYNFDFDFFRSDRLVCTEIVYRAFDGLENMRFTLHNRAGRQTLAAEDLLDMAIDTDEFQVIGLYGYPRAVPEIITQTRAQELLIESYRSSPD